MERQEEMNEPLAAVEEDQQPVQENLMEGLIQQKRGQKDFHPFMWFSCGLNDEEWIDETTAWLISEATEGFVYCRTKNCRKTLKCQCFSILGNEELACAVAEYLLFFGKTTASERDRIVMDMMRYQQDITPPQPIENHRRFRIPFVASSDINKDAAVKRLLREHYVCVNTLQHLLSWGKKKMKRIQSDIKSGLMIPRRPRFGLPSNRRASLEKKQVMDDLRLYFEHLCNMEEPRATRLVREVTGIGVRDDEMIDLPSYMTKRGLYAQFCWYRGMKVTTTAKGNSTVVARDDNEWTQNADEPMECPSWTTFRRFWKAEFPRLCIQKPAKDICGECYKFSLAHKMKIRTKGRAASSSAVDVNEENDIDSTDDEIESDGSESAQQTEDPGQYREVERLIMEASAHVQDARAQRDLVAAFKERAVQTINEDPRNRTFMFYFDYAQNIECPFFGEQQPGETYYYSPLSINVFGIADASRSSESLHAYCYHEGEGQKGGNNVVSMLQQFLFRQVGCPIDTWFANPQKRPWGGHLVLVCDNCSGQNKNRMVLRYIVYLVETLKFAKVTLIFLIAGHTKNPCDRLFNLLKKGYREKNLFDVDTTVSTLGEHSLVTAERFTKFRDWDTYFDTYYSRPKSVKKWHLFEVDSETSDRPDPRTLMWFRISARQGVETETQQFKPRNAMSQDERDDLLCQAYDYPVRLNAPGIRSIKKNELWKKFKKLVPVQFHDCDIYQKPTDDELAELQQQKAQKLAARVVEKEARKRRQQEESAAV